MSQVRIIKKYPNRRLYDTEISSYVTLEDVRQLIIDGESFEVREAKTGKDLTRAVLLQIIAEHEDIGSPIFSTQLLTQVIRFYGDSLQGYIGGYLERSVALFNEQQSQLRSLVGNLVGQTPWALINQITERNLELLKGLQQGLLGSLGGGKDDKARPAEKPRTLSRPATRPQRRTRS
jgi:polyhydroxyalkanoate synthesis repressor PhaR